MLCLIDCCLLLFVFVVFEFRVRRLACVCCGLSFVVKRSVLGALCYCVSGVSCLLVVG